jgi:Uma2 family endonuclease
MHLNVRRAHPGDFTMATKPIKKTKPKAAARKESKPKTTKEQSAGASETQTKTIKRKPAEAADTRTKTKTPKPKPAQAQDGKTKTARRKLTEVRGSRHETTQRKPAHAPATPKRKPEGNGRVAATSGHRTKKQGPQVNGKVKQGHPQAKPDETRIASTLFHSLESYAKSHNLGRVAGEMHFDWGDIENPDLRPDMAFVSFGRWAPYRYVPTTLTWHVVPDLVVEIVHESEQTEEFGTRLNDYFKAGVSRVWVVYPHDLRIFDYQSPSEYRILNRDEWIDGGTLLPGFQLPLTELVGEEK